MYDQKEYGTLVVRAGIVNGIEERRVARRESAEADVAHYDEMRLSVAHGQGGCILKVCHADSPGKDLGGINPVTTLCGS